MTVKEFPLFIWNGGLDPEVADPGQLRRRRTLATTWVLLIPIAGILLLTNAFYSDAADENIEVGAVILVALLGLYLQAFKGWERFASYSMVAIFWLATASVMYRGGINSSNWTWMLSAALLANLIASRTVAILFTVVAIATLITFALMTNNGYLPQGLVLEEHGLNVGIVGCLGLITMSILGYTFRTMQIVTRRKMKANLVLLAEEIDNRHKAEKAALAGQKAKATFLATVSHELRTPLNGVMGAGQLLTKTGMYENEKELIDSINSSSDVLLDLINNVLDLSRLEAGRMELEHKELHVESLIRSAVTPFLLIGKNKNLQVNYQIDQDVPDYIVSDATRIRQIILNLCGNAIKFTEQGSVELHVSCQASELKINVIDSGIGIASEAVDQLFQPFTQAESTAARRYSGSGLGLTIVAELMGLFGGNIKVQSTPGLGSTFTITLPFKIANPITQTPARVENSTEVTVKRNLVVLVTDDNVINRKVASKMLEQLGCIVVEAVDGNEALASIRSRKIDVVLMDVNMPVMDGLTATSHIRAMDTPLCNTPIIGLSANTSPSDITSLLAAGMNGSLSKPVKLEALYDAIKQTRLLL